MKVFISWSGQRTKQIAHAMNRALSLMNGRLDPWISDSIEKGTPWSTILSGELAAHESGIACVTRESFESPWLLFESGAISKQAGSRLIPILFDVNDADLIGNPLSSFQNSKFNKLGIHDLMRSLNKYLGERAQHPQIVDEAFESHWPKLESEVRQALAGTPRKQDDKRSDAQLSEIVGLLHEQLRKTEEVRVSIRDLSPAALIGAPYREMAHLLAGISQILALTEKSLNGAVGHHFADDSKSMLELMEAIVTSLNPVAEAMANASTAGAAKNSLTKANLILRRNIGTLEGRIGPG